MRISNLKTKFDEKLPEMSVAKEFWHRTLLALTFRASYDVSALLISSQSHDFSIPKFYDLYIS